MTRWPDTRLQRLLGIEHPIIQGGMVYNSGARLAAAVSNAGGLGLIGAGSLRPDAFGEQVRKARALTDRPFGVNLPLLYPHVAECLEIALAEGVRVFFTSAGSPRAAASRLKEAGCAVVHVVAHPDLARKCEEAGCDAVVCEGFEAGGHNGRDEITTLVLVPECVRAVSIPVIAAGGIATGAQVAAMLALGAAGVQVGSRFAVTVESSGHDAFKRAVAAAGPGDTRLVLKAHVPVRLLRNAFRERIEALEARGATRAELVAELGQGRARRGMLEGDLQEGELEIGQVAGLIDDIPPAAEVVRRLVADCGRALARLTGPGTGDGAGA
ncbi:nitronate monooxygenase [bacterium]|nr:nitronate monooxygenase [bacterium]